MGSNLYYRELARDLSKELTAHQFSELDLQAQVDFPFFCGHVTRTTPEPKYQPEHMQTWNDVILTGQSSNCLLQIAGQNTSIRASRGAAKAQPVDEPVLTSSGWVRMGNLKVGDFVIGGNGKKTKIINVQPQGVKANYRVTFTDGSFTECSDDHLWSVRLLSAADSRAFQTLTLNHIRTKIFVKSGGAKTSRVVTTYRDATPEEKPWLDYRGYARYHIPVVEPIEFAKQDLPLDPYLLGVLIGDGSLTNSTICFSTADDELLELLKPCIHENYEIKPHGKHPCNFTICVKKPEGYTGKPRSPIIAGLRDLKLWGKRAETKFIPSIYLLGSVAEREALLQGLLDTDGTVTSRKRNGGLSFCSTSEQLICDVVALVQSLGGIATVHQPQRNFYTHNGEKKQGQISWKIGIKLPASIVPFRLARKLQNYSPCTKLMPTRGIIDIELIGETEMQCITVQHSDQLYVTRNYVVTHNSTYLAFLAAWLIGIHTMNGMRLPILYISYTVDVASPKSGAIKGIIESPEYQMIFPSVKPGKKWGDEHWEIDYKWAGINVLGDDPFTLWCAGLKGAITSKRSAISILDDLIKSPDDIASADIRAQMDRNWTRSIMPTMLDGGRAIHIGNLQRADDIQATRFTVANKWQVISQKAIIQDEEGNEKTYWDFYSLKFLQDIRDQDPVGFSFQYQNEIVRINEIAINPEWITECDPYPIEEYEALVIGLDLSSKLKEKNDFTVFVLGGRKVNDYHLLDSRRGRWAGNIEKLDVMLEMLVDWGLLEWTPHPPDKIAEFERLGINTQSGNSLYGRTKGLIQSVGIVVYLYAEDVSYQGSLAGDFQSYIVNELQLYDLIYRPSPARSDKLMRLRSVSGLYENGVVKFNRWRSLAVVKTELTNFGSTQFDDACDSSVHCLLGLRGLTPLEAG